MITAIVEWANEELPKDSIKIKAFLIPFGNGASILMVWIIPLGGDDT